MDKNLASALLKAQAGMGKLIKDSNNPHFNSTYASLAAVMDTVRGPLTDAGLVLYQSASSAEGLVIVRSMLIHAETGETIEEQLALPVAQKTPQAMGSAITYGRRYLAMAMCGLSPDDDDANGASQPAKPQAEKKAEKKAAPAPTPQAQAAHRPARQPAPPQPPASLSTPTLESDVDFEQGKQWDNIPSAAESDAQAQALMLDVAQGLLHNPDITLSDNATRMIAKLRQLDKESGDKYLSTVKKDGTGSGQYGLLVSKIDRATAKDAHRFVLAAIFGYPVDKENPPGWKAKELIDWLADDAAGREVTAATLKEIWTAIQEASKAHA